jgi:hypothetical protein
MHNYKVNEVNDSIGHHLLGLINMFTIFGSIKHKFMQLEVTEKQDDEHQFVALKIQK